MDRMKTLDLPGLAVKYKDLSNKVMEHEVNRYVQVFRALPPATSTPMAMPMSTPGFFDTHLAMDVDSQDAEFFSTFGTGEPADLVWEDGFLQFE